MAKPASAQETSAAPPVLDPEARAHVRRVVEASGTSFLQAMKLLSAPRREAMFAIYAFCREVDDIADEPAPLAEKIAGLNEWRREIGRLFAGKPRAPTARALAGPVARYGLAKEDFLALIEGMELDAKEPFSLKTMRELEHYCDRVACAVGRLSVKAFGADGPRASDAAFYLGQALQLTNILRDLREDAERGRLYLPVELLKAHRIAAREPDKVLAHARLPEACAELAMLARRRFAEAEAVMAELPRRPLRPALVMMHVYRRILDRLIQRGWQRLDEPVSLGKPVKLWIALRYGIG